MLPFGSRIIYHVSFDRFLCSLESCNILLFDIMCLGKLVESLRQLLKLENEIVMHNHIEKVALDLL